MLNIQAVTVIGVTGTMGANIAGIFASFGDAKVYCIGRDINKVKKTIPRIVVISLVKGLLDLLQK